MKRSLPIAALGVFLLIVVTACGGGDVAETAEEPVALVGALSPTPQSSMGFSPYLNWRAGTPSRP